MFKKNHKFHLFDGNDAPSKISRLYLLTSLKQNAVGAIISDEHPYFNKKLVNFKLATLKNSEEMMENFQHFDQKKSQIPFFDRNDASSKIARL